MNKAILVVSFGTSYEDTRKKTIDVIEEKIAQAFPDHRIYRAWTSKMIINKIHQRDRLIIPTVSEAMETLYRDGIEEVILQPTHVLNGIENDLMTSDALVYSDKFKKISMGQPLLTSTEDSFFVIDTLMDSFPALPPSQALIFMGHGSSHHANYVYGALNDILRDKGYHNVFVGTVEGYPDLDYILRHLKEKLPEKVYLTPFMIVAGDHATKDMASDDPDSWKSQIEALGIDVEIIMKGLGEYPGIQELFIDHIRRSKN